MLTRIVALALAAATAVAADGPGFLRGMGWSPWHAVYGWGRPPEVVAQDYKILADLHVNALRTWGPASRKGCDAHHKHGLYLVPQLRRGKMPRMKFKDGKEGFPVYTAQEALADIRSHATALATSLKGHPGVVAYNLGNEYSWVGRNKSGSYQSLGFDAATQQAFHEALRGRFGSIGRWNKLTGRTDASFDAIVPSTGTGKDLAYWEWWRYQREVFGEFLRAGHKALREVDPRTPVTYALLCGGRWDAATEDAALDFLELQGDNLYYHWSKDWGPYCLRLARRIGPGRPILITESGVNTWTFKDPGVSARLMKQMLWVLALHPEVRGIFPFVYCDEWWHGPDRKAQDVSGDAWGIVTADRKAKATYAPLRDTYAEFERLHEFMSTRQSPIEVLVTDQAIDRWRGVAGPGVGDVCRELYRRGMSFRLVSLLRPADLKATKCKRLVLLDSTIPDEPDGASPARDALAAFSAQGGQILYLCDKPWRGLYLPDGGPAAMAAKVIAATGDAWPAIQAFLGKRSATVTAESGEIFWRRLRGAGQQFLLLVATGPAPVARVKLEGISVSRLESADGAKLFRSAGGCELLGLDTYALLRVGAEGR